MLPGFPSPSMVCQLPLPIPSALLSSPPRAATTDLVSFPEGVSTGGHACIDKYQLNSLCASLHKWERFVKDDRAVKRPARTSRIRRNDANLAIPQRAIELLGAIPLTRI